MQAPVAGQGLDLLGYLRCQPADAEALVSGRRAFSYAELLRSVDGAACALQSLGLRPGDRVAACLADPGELVLAFLATQRLGLVWVGVNRTLPPRERTYQVNDCAAALLLADAEVLADWLPVDHPMHLIDVASEAADGWVGLRGAHDGEVPLTGAFDLRSAAAIAYTSGTTGRPRGVVHSQHNILTFPLAGLSSGRAGTWAPGLRRCCTVPLSILNCMIFGPVTALISGGTYICADRPDAATVAATIEQHHVEVINTVATTVYDLLHRPDLASYHLRSLRYAAAGGALVSDELKEGFQQRFGSELVEEYGLTEAPCSVAGGSSGERTPAGSVGRPYPHVDVAAYDLDGRRLPAGATGELGVRPATSGSAAVQYTPMLAYLGCPNETSEALKDGRLHTGDLGYVDEAGFLFIVGRVKDVILRGGANVYPAEVERVLRLSDRIDDVLVLGEADPRLGHIVAAYLQVVGNHDGLRAELTTLCREHLPRYKTPERWYVSTELPRTALHKIDRAAVRRDVPNQLVD